MKKILVTLIITLVAIWNCAFAQSLTVKMLNVGQGEAILIQTDTQNVLIDTSDVDERQKLAQELYKAECYRLDKVILTHPHADHIGNAAWLLKNGVFSVRTIYDNGLASTSKYYKEYMQELKWRNVPRLTAKAGETIQIDEDVYFEVLSSGGGFKNINDDSIVGRLVFKEFSMMLTGDAESYVEQQLVNESDNLRSTILKAGHHGSKTSNTLGFVRAVSPQYVLISAGQPTTKRGGNTYGHPHKQALENFLIAGVAQEKIFWTHKNGTITIRTDGFETSVVPEVADNWLDDYLGYRLTITTL